jgi:hypothetical protein
MDWLDEIDTLDKARAEYERLRAADDLGGESERRLLAKWLYAAEKPAGDEHLGTFVYCASHLRPHSTGWCSVDPDHKVCLTATTIETAYAEVARYGLYVFGSDANRGSAGDKVGDLMSPFARASRQRHPRSWLTPLPHRAERDRLLNRIREIRGTK